MGSKLRAEHVCIGPGGRFQCNHCGATHDPFNGAARELWAIESLGAAFAKQHSRCRKPKSALCPFCFSPEHAWHEHVNATTRGPADWWGCKDTGVSSQAIWRHMMGMPVLDGSYPHDPDDFGRCHRLLSAPWAAAWRRRIGEMARYGGVWARLVARWADMERLYVEEFPSGKAPKLYELMKELRRQYEDQGRVLAVEKT